MDLDEPGLGRLEDEREGVEHEVGAEPDVLAALRRDPLAEVRRVRPAHEAVHAVRAHDEVRVQLGDVGHLGIEAQLGAELARAQLEDVQEQLARDGREGVAARAQQPPAMVDVDRGPARERVGDLQVALGVGVAQRAERLLGEHDAPAERRVGCVALDDGDVMGAVGLLEQDRQVEAGRAGADDAHSHASTSARRSS